MPVNPLPDDTFGGYSWGRAEGARIPFRGMNTVEGLASSVALTERYQQQQQQKNVGGNSTLSRDVLKEVSDENAIWDHAANALANLCATLLLVLSMEKIVLGGGILQRTCLLPKIRHRTAAILNGYLGDDLVWDSIITVSEYGDDAGLVGAIRLAQRALQQEQQEEQDSIRSKQQKQEAF